MPYLDMVPTVLTVLAWFGGGFVAVAAFLRQRFGARAVWGFWIIYLVGITATCVYKLSGLRYGVFASTLGRAVYLGAVALVGVGIPLALGALVLVRRNSGSNVRAAVFAWMACVATTPVAVSLVAVVDFVHLMVETA
ncbi:MAG TPA: hypothetical protein VF042_04710 [Gemmatimonadaceae bacterium]